MMLWLIEQNVMFFLLYILCLLILNIHNYISFELKNYISPLLKLKAVIKSNKFTVLGTSIGT